MRNIYILYFREKLCHCLPYAVIFTFSSTPIFIRNWSMHPKRLFISLRNVLKLDNAWVTPLLANSAIQVRFPMLAFVVEICVGFSGLNRNVIIILFLNLYKYFFFFFIYRDYNVFWCNNHQPEDHGSCIAHLCAEDMLLSAAIEEKKFKHIPWAGADDPLGPKF